MVTLQAISECRSIKPIRNTVKANILNLPGVVSLLIAGFKLKPEMALRHEMTASGAVTSPFNVPWDEALFQLRVAGQPMLNGRLACRSPEPPFHLTGGLLMLEAAHPERPQHRLMVRVLAAKRN
jgi:hypothetical protein